MNEEDFVKELSGIKTCGIAALISLRHGMYDEKVRMLNTWTLNIMESKIKTLKRVFSNFNGIFFGNSSLNIEHQVLDENVALDKSKL